jgi:hypothetical protein
MHSSFADVFSAANFLASEKFMNPRVHAGFRRIAIVSSTVRENCMHGLLREDWQEPVLYSILWP